MKGKLDRASLTTVMLSRGVEILLMNKVALSGLLPKLSSDQG